MGHIPEDFISNLLDNIDIVDIIGSYVPLKKSGHNYMGCCPFHHEKTPSFSVVQSKRFYHCFGCGAGGSSIKFVMEIEKLSFVDAVSKLAAIAGMDVPFVNNGSNKLSIDKVLYKINQLVFSLYKNNLLKDKAAQSYLQKRGIIPEIWDKFQLGYSTAAWGNLEEVIKTNPEININLLKQAGLWIENKNSYARFRNRIMFPIHNIQGKIIGFGGRIFNDSSQNQPKYLNSPETIIFKKGNELYGLYQAVKYKDISKNSQSDNSFLMVEGYMDVISLVQHGISNVVATLGTSASHQHFVKLFKYTEKIIICFDGDIAGRRAAYRAMQQALPVIRADKVINFCFLPEGHDPDSYILKHGKSGFENFLKNSESLSTFIFNNLAKELDINSPEGRAKFVSYLRAIVNKVYDEIVKEFLLEDLAKKLELDLERLKNMLAVNTTSSFNNPNINTNINHTNHIQKTAQIVNNYGHNKVLKKAASILIQFPELIELVKKYSIIDEHGDQDNLILLQLIQIIKEGACTTGQVLDNWNEPQSKEYIFQLALIEHLVNKKELELELEDILQNLNKFNKGYEIEELLTKVKANGMGTLSNDEKLKLTELLKEK